MLLQHVVRGVGGIARKQAETVMHTSGLLCSAIRNGHAADVESAERLLSPENLDRHRHDHPRFADESPYISTSAGTYAEGNRLTRATRSFYAFDTALEFAVLGPRTHGWIFYGYVFLLGRASGQHAEFAEEVRDLHQHPAWSRYRSEGEIAVAVRIPPRRLRRAELYTLQSVVDAIGRGTRPSPDDVIDNETDGIYQAPELLTSAREVI